MDRLAAIPETQTAADEVSEGALAALADRLAGGQSGGSGTAAVVEFLCGK